MNSGLFVMGCIRISLVFLVLALVTGCAGKPLNCDLFQMKSSDYRQCRANEGSKEYQFQVAMEAYVRGDYSKSKKFLNRAAREISAVQVVKFGSKYYDTPADQVNFERRDGGGNGHKGAHFMLGEMYRNGTGVKSNGRLAARHTASAANRQIKIEEQQDKYIIRTMARIDFSSDPSKIGNFFEYSVFNIPKMDDPKL